MKRTVIGEVVSAKNDKTVTIEVNRVISHPVYKKQYTKSRHFQVHDEKNEANVGDRIEAEETRPVSKTKTWKLVKVVEKAQELGGGKA